jgi:MoxR-like ATPase
VTDVFYDVLGHRVKLSAKARANGYNVATALDYVRSQIKIPRT